MVLPSLPVCTQEVYISKLKHDSYFWCFPQEGGAYTIHEAVDFVHNRVLDALEVVQREERNKSLQTLFKEVNDHTTNAFEFGKNFLAYLLTTTKKAGADLTTSSKYDGEVRLCCCNLHPSRIHMTSPPPSIMQNVHDVLASA